MTSHEKLSALAQRTGLLRPDQSPESAIPNAVTFTRLAAWELREDGWACVRSTESDASHGIRLGVLINRETRAQVRIIASEGTTQQTLVWEELPRAAANVEHERPIDPTGLAEFKSATAATPATTTKLSDVVDADDQRAAFIGLFGWYTMADDHKPTPAKLAEEAVEYASALAKARQAKK